MIRKLLKSCIESVRVPVNFKSLTLIHLFVGPKHTYDLTTTSPQPFLPSNQPQPGSALPVSPPPCRADSALELSQTQHFELPHFQQHLQSMQREFFSPQNQDNPPVASTYSPHGFATGGQHARVRDYRPVSLLHQPLTHGEKEPAQPIVRYESMCFAHKNGLSCS